MVGEYDSAGTPIQETIFLEGIAVAVIKPRSAGGGENAYYIYADHLATPRVIARSSDNKMAWRWDRANPFGEDWPDEIVNSQETFRYNLRFPGQYYDRGSNLNYNFFRDYDPQTARYIQSDPIGLAGGINTYGYVGENPLSRSDPLGLSWKCTTVGLVTTCTQTPPLGSVDPLDQPLPNLSPNPSLSDTFAQAIGENLILPLHNLLEASTGKEKKRCEKIKDKCIQKCSSETLPTQNYGWDFTNCLNKCMRDAGCKPPSAGEK